ncbi:MAG TPA: TRAP transporter substrate-binding protein [Gammaproteobacteria bacterium]|nr:TRAP transporter substrate-binding protein [Gammaproteobacteria bacterium]
MTGNRGRTGVFGRSTAAFSALLAVTCAYPAEAPQVFTLKLSHYAPSVHHQHAVTFVNWAKELEERSGGRLKLDIYPAEQLGKLSQQYNLVRRGDVDIAFFMHGTPAGRFPLMELTHLPLLFKSGEQQSQVLMSLVPEYLAAEHRGVKILYLFGHSPGVILTRSRPVHRPEDLQGLRIRHPSAVIGETLRAWGASPAGMPPGEIAENLDKGVIDGLVLPYDGALGFRLAPYLRYSTEVFSYVNSFGVIMNPQSYEQLPPDLQQLIDDTTGMRAAREVGARWDSMEVPGKKYMVDNGIEIIELSDEQRALFATAGQSVIEQRLASTEAKGLPAREFLTRVRDLAAQF